MNQKKVKKLRKQYKSLKLKDEVQYNIKGQVEGTTFRQFKKNG